jgi:hypothetical protein
MPVFFEFAESMVIGLGSEWLSPAESLTLPEFDPRRGYHQPGGYKEPR